MLRNYPEVAFFDIDNTLINVKSMFSFQEHLLGHGDAYASFLSRLYDGVNRQDRLTLNRRYYEEFKGKSVAIITTSAGEWFASLSKRLGSHLWITPTLNMLEGLRHNGTRIVAVSGSCHAILRPLLREIGVDSVIATELEIRNGCYTGRIIPPQVIGDGKVQLIQQYASLHSINLDNCFACGDHMTDLPMLEIVGSVCVVAGDIEMAKIAKSRGWQIIYGSRHECKQIDAHL